MGNIFFVDKFLGGAFLTYGSDVLKFSDMDQENRSDPMIEVSLSIYPELSPTQNFPHSDLPACDQVYIPQVWSLRQHPKARRPLRVGSEHPERKNLHLPLVSSLASPS